MRVMKMNGKCKTTSAKNVLGGSVAEMIHVRFFGFILDAEFLSYSCSVFTQPERTKVKLH